MRPLDAYNKTKNTPSFITKTSHFRVKLDTKKNQRTGFSQHELLWNLKDNKEAMVYYACPMIFSKEELYDIEVDIETLQLVDVISCPSPYQDNEIHYIYFDDKKSSPYWCSEPVRGEGISPKDFVKLLIEKVSEGRVRESAESLFKTLEIFRLGNFEHLSSIMTIIRVSHSTKNESDQLT